MKAKITYIAGMKKRQVQYTIRDVPGRVNAALRIYAAEEGVSLNQAAVDILAKGLGVTGREKVYHDLDHLAGAWVEDPEFDRAIEEMDKIDPEMWE